MFDLHISFAILAILKPCILAIEKIKGAAAPAGKKQPTGKTKKATATKTAAKNVTITEGSAEAKATGRPSTAQTKKAATTKTPAPTKTVKSVALKAAPKKTVLPKTAKTGLQKIIFQIRFHTTFGQSLYLTGNHPLLGNGDPEKAVPLQYFNNEYWYLVLELSAKDLTDSEITYQYILRNADGIVNYDWGNDKALHLSSITATELLVIDSWNYAGYFENTFYTEPFADVLLKANHTDIPAKTPKLTTHLLKVKTPLLAKGQTLCVLGSCDSLGNWNQVQPVLMQQAAGQPFYTAALDLSNESFPVA